MPVSSESTRVFSERYESVRFVRKRNVDWVYANPHDFLHVLQNSVSTWETELASLEQLVSRLGTRDVEERQELRDIRELVEIGLRLVDVFNCVALSIGPPLFESTQRQIKDTIGKLLDDIAMLLDYFTPGKQSVYQLDTIIELLSLQLRANRLGIASVKRGLRNSELQISRRAKDQKPLEQFGEWVGRKLIDGRTQLSMMVFASVLLLL